MCRRDELAGVDGDAFRDKAEQRSRQRTAGRRERRYALRRELGADALLVRGTGQQQRQTGTEVLDHRHPRRTLRVDAAGQVPGDGKAKPIRLVAHREEDRYGRADRLDEVRPELVLVTYLGDGPLLTHPGHHHAVVSRTNVKKAHSNCY